MDQPPDHSHIPGWGIDATLENEPTFPMRHRTGREHDGYNWSRPTQQKAEVEILHSNERPNLSAVFGTSTPPCGISGMLRRFAFRYNESNYGHWLPLMMADRVAVLEGVLGDLGRGHVPNVFAERGCGADWKYNRLSLMARVVVGTLVLGVLCRWLRCCCGDDCTAEED